MEQPGLKPESIWDIGHNMRTTPFSFFIYVGGRQAEIERDPRSCFNGVWQLDSETCNNSYNSETWVHWFNDSTQQGASSCQEWWPVGNAQKWLRMEHLPDSKVVYDVMMKIPLLTPYLHLQTAVHYM